MQFGLKLVFILALMACNVSFAGQSGYIANGQVNIVYTDGKKVGQWPGAGKKSKERKPSSQMVWPRVLYFEEDEIARCYTFSSELTPKHTHPGTINCVRK